MTAALEFGGRQCWGTNGAVEDIVGRMASVASVRLGPASPIAQALGRESREFWMGKIVNLGDVSDDARTLGELISLARAEALREGGYSEFGRAWLNGDLLTFATHLSLPAGP